jgi:C-terminal processing protease CtpA/Prc
MRVTLILLASFLITRVHVSDAEVVEFELEFREPGALGLQLDSQLRVVGFPRVGKGERPGPVELSGVVRLQDSLVAINDEVVTGLSLSDVGQVLRESAEVLPRILRFAAADGQRRELSAMGKRAAGHVTPETLSVFVGLTR